MQKTTGLTRAGSGRASGRSQRSLSFASSLNYDGKIAGLYDLEETLGRGHFAVVKLARHVFTGEKVAVKVIDKTKLDEISRAHLFQEVRCMKLVQHPNVVRLYEVIDTQTKLYLILELGDGGDLYDYIMRHENGLDEESARHYFRQVVHAISYCHQLHVVHRDLKPENVVFFEKLGMVKLTDFGFSNKYNPGQKLETSCGSLAYSAPEILLGDSYDAPAVDIWSLGVILYMLVCGHPPFQEANDSETLTMIMDCKYTVPPHVSEQCRRLISRMLQRDPVKRAALEEIANDPWLEAGSTIQPADYLPLVSREHLSEDDHALILQKMVNGNIATKEEILDALDKNEYNNITATYFLLAERKLRAQRQEHALMLSRGQRPEFSTTGNRLTVDDSVHQKERMPSPEERRLLTTESSPTGVVSLTARTLDSPQKCHVRPRKYSIVDEEDDTGGSGSEGSARRSQRSSSNSLTSQRTSNTSLASQRTSNNSLAGSLRSRGLLNANTTATLPNPRVNLPIVPRTNDLRLDLNTQQECRTTSNAANKITEHVVVTDQAVEVPAPFPTTSNIGLGLRSPRASPLTSPVSCHRSSVLTHGGSGRTTPSSISPTSPSTPSSPGSSPNIMSPQSGTTVKSRSSLPSPNRVLHAVRSSPQLVLNEIFEEGESGSDNEIDSGHSRPDKAIVGMRHRMSTPAIGQGPPVARRMQARASSVGSNVYNPNRPSGSSNSPPSLVRRYEQRRQLAKARTASCSSSDASDDDNESRKKRADKLKSLPRRDSHDDSSDPGGEGPSGADGDGAGLASGGGTYSVDRCGSNTQESNGGSHNSGKNHANHTSTSSSRTLLQQVECTMNDRSRTRYRVGNGTAHRRYSNTSYTLLSPGMGSETHLRASQSLSCLTEVCEINDCPNPTSLDIPVTTRIPTRSCTNLEQIDEGLADVAEFNSEETKTNKNEASSQFPDGETAITPTRSSDGMQVQSAEKSDHNFPAAKGAPKTVPEESKKHKRIKHLFSRREGSGSSFKRGEKRPGSRRLRLRSNVYGGKEEVEMEYGSEEMNGTSCSAEAVGPTDGKGKTLNFFRSRLYKAKSLGSLVKERILVEASNCQYELWKRFGRKADVNQNQSSGSLPSSRSSSKRFSRGAKHRLSSDCSQMCENSVAVVHGLSKNCSPC